MLWGKTNLKGVIFISFSDIQRKNFGFLSKSFRQGCQYCILRIHDNILKDFSWGKLISFYLFRRLSEKFSGSWHNFFWQGCQNCIIRVCRNNFEEKKLVWKKYNLNHFRILREKLSDFCEKVYGRVVKAASIVFIETIWELNSLKKKYFSQNHLRHWAGSFALVVKTFLTGFSKLHSKCPDDHFEEK